ncbi:MAG: hypothetical protein GY716_07830 [bacterium]|nr:hypothetical protein [bacterium]
MSRTLNARRCVAIPLALLLATVVAGGLEAAVTRQLVQQDPTITNSWAIDDAGTTVFAAATGDPVGANPLNAFQVFAFDSTTGAAQQLTSFTGGEIRDLTVSDDGLLLAFVSDGDPLLLNGDRSYELFSMNADGSNLAQLTQHAIAPGVAEAVLAGSGNRIVFTATEDPTFVDTGLFLIDPDGSNLDPVATGPGSDPWRVRISDDGLRLMFHSYGDMTGGNADGSLEIFVEDADGSDLRRLTDTSTGAWIGDFSGNGGTVAFVATDNLTGGNPSQNAQIFAVEWDGTGLRQVTNFPTFVVPAPSLRDDGGLLVYDAEDILWEIGTDGTGQRQLEGAFQLQGPSVSGNGKTVAYMTFQGLKVRDDIQSGPRPLTWENWLDSKTPDISSDGNTVIFGSTFPTYVNRDLFRVNRDGSDLEQVTTFLTSVESYALSGDGSFLIATARSSPDGQTSTNSSQIYRLELASGNTTALSNFTSYVDGIQEVDVSTDGSRLTFVPVPLLLQDTELFCMNTDGSGMTSLIVTPGDIRDARIDGSGTWLTFAGRDDLLPGQNPEFGWEVFRMRCDGTGLTQISSGPEVAWEPDISDDGLRVAYVSQQDPLGTNPGHLRNVFLYEVDTATTRQLSFVAPGETAWQARISGDGSTVYFTARTALFEETGELELYRVSATGGPIRRSNARPGEVREFATDHSGDRVVFLGRGDFTNENPDLEWDYWISDWSEPATLSVSGPAPTALDWPHEPQVIRYDAIRGDLAGLTSGSIGDVICLRNDSAVTGTVGFEDTEDPFASQAFFYLFRGSSGVNAGPGSYGQASDGSQRVPSGGDCSP